jgi:hypothetical protein
LFRIIVQLVAPFLAISVFYADSLWMNLHYAIDG